MIGRIPSVREVSITPAIRRLEWGYTLTPHAEQHTRVSDQRCQPGKAFTNAADIGLSDASLVL